MIWAIEFDERSAVVGVDGTVAIAMTNRSSFAAQLTLETDESVRLGEVEAALEDVDLEVPPNATVRCPGSTFELMFFTLLQLRSSVRPLSEMITQRRLRFAGHVLRLPRRRLPKTALTWRPAHGKRKQGRPRTTWRRTFTDD